MRRFSILGLIALAAAMTAGVQWLRAEGKSVVEVTDEEIEAARKSGAGARTLDEGSLPTLEELKSIGRRADLERVAERVAEARAEETDAAERALLGDLAREDAEACHRFALESAEALPDNSRAHHALAKAMLAKVAKEARAGGTAGIGAALKTIKPYLAEVRTAIELDPSNVDARVSEIVALAYAPWPVGDKKRAKSLIEELAPYDELRRDFWRAQLLVAGEKKDFGPGIAAYRDLLARYPDDLDIVLTLADLQHRAGEFRQAAETLAALVKRKADTPWILRARYMAAKARERGEFELDRALDLLDDIEEADPVGDLMPSLGRIAYHKGCVLRKLGKLEEARRELRRASDVEMPREDVTSELAAVEAELGGQGHGER